MPARGLLPGGGSREAPGVGRGDARAVPGCMQCDAGPDSCAGVASAHRIPNGDAQCWVAAPDEPGTEDARVYCHR